MRYAAVKHQPSSGKWYWFNVPESLSRISPLLVGREVLCDTRMGVQRGWIVKVFETEKKTPQIVYDFQIPTRSIVAIRSSVPMKKITIPDGYYRPSSSKIKQRVDEYYKAGRFHTDVCFDTDNVLEDGYTAYLVAKMFGLDHLSGFVFADQEVVKNSD